MLGVVRIPHGASILEKRSDKGLVGSLVYQLGPIFTVRPTSPRVVLALSVTALVWASQVAAEVSITHTYLV